MIEKIKQQIEAINESLEWLHEHKNEQYEQRFVPLVQQRCRLRKIMEAKKENPAIAAYGESQKGKSYLMGNLLQKDGKPFMITLPSGEKINFVRSINPIGKMREATGVVTRFTAFNGKNAERYSKEYPVLMKLLTVSDMATILCDSYYNDLRDPKHYSDAEIKEKGEAIYNKYKAYPVQKDAHLTADDILDIKTYVKQNMTSKAYSLINGTNSTIFDKVALVIDRVPEKEWSEVMSFLWHENPVFTQLYTRLVGAMSRLGFPREVYLPIDAVRHHGVNENTIMSVACLNGLDKPNFDKKTDVFVRHDGGFTKFADFNKAELCAICAETAYRVDQDYLSTKAAYCMDMLPAETRAKMKKSEVDKDVINVTDLLDFPGARNRESIAEDKLSDYDEKEGASNTVKTLLRGKVAYLFNKYCASRAINILMFCHDQMNYSVTNMPFVIENWVKEYVGKTPEDRQKTLGRSEGISPLFIIATKFNMDMTLDQDNMASELNSEAAVDGRWNGRFQEVLYRDCLQAHSVEWFNNWVREGETFKNTYLLRDYKYSTCSGDGSGLYEGYNEDDETPRETKMHLPEVFYDRLRSSFTKSEIVKKFFDDPAKSWDLASTLNNDGALYIIERLRTVAYAMDSIRDNQFIEEIKESINTVRKLMENDYESEDGLENTKKDVKMARSIKRELDFSCQMDMYFFGHLIQTLQIDGTKVFNIVHNLIEQGDLVNGPDDAPYEIIRKSCRDFEGCNTIDDMKKRVMDVYGFDTWEEAEEDLRRRGIKIEILFQKKKVKLSNSAVISTAIYDTWVQQLRSSDLLNALASESNHDMVALTALTKRIIDAAEELRLSEEMDKATERYLNIVALKTAKADLVADILAHQINSFVVDLGYSLRTKEYDGSDAEEMKKYEKRKEQFEGCKQAAEQFGIDLFRYIGKGIQELPDEEDISALFTQMLAENHRMTKTFEQNYYEWIEYMFIAFLSSTAHIIKNPEANKALGEILRKLTYA